MKLTVALMLTACLGVQAAGFAQKVDLSLKNTPLKKVFTEIKKQTGFFFLYDEDLLNRAGTVSMDIKNADLGEALDLALSNRPLTYQIIDKTVTIIARPLTHTDRKMADIVVKGNVKLKSINGSEESLPGVSVSVKGLHRAVSTDGNGNYSITVREDAVLVFSFIGYGKKEVAVSGKTSINVVLQETVSALNEVVVTGYGTRERKENQVGSATTVTARDLQMKPVGRIDQLLDGLVPGLQFNLQDKNAGSARPRYQTRIRGEGSIDASSDPLWVIDDIPLYTGNENNQINGVQTSISPLTYMNPADIESITVLKDAAATTLYGANGSNGVVLITTKKGSLSGTRVSYNFRTGVNLLNRKFNVLSGDEYRELFNESFANSGEQSYPFKKDNETNTDWYDRFFRNGITMVHDLSFNGGNEKTQYYISGSYYRDKPIEIANSIERFSSRINLNQKVSRKLNVSFKVGGSYNINDLFAVSNDYDLYRPNINPYNEDGSFALYDNSRTTKVKFLNNLAEAEQNDYTQKAAVLNGKLGVEYKIIDGLTLSSTNGVGYNAVTEDIYQSMNNWSGIDLDGTPMGYFTRYQSNNMGWTSINRLNFNRTFGENAFDGVIGMEASDNTSTTMSSGGFGFPNDKIRELGSFIIDQNQRASTGRSEQSALSFYSLANYTWKRRYSLLASFRREGNSDFGTDVRWAKFASAGAAWTISNESFWKSKFVNFAKLKVSYGSNGNSRIGTYQSKGIYTFNSDYYYNDEYSAIMQNGENPLLSWETTHTFNTGVSLGLGQRIFIELELYNDVTSNLLNKVDVSRTTGDTQIYQNIGKMQNRGMELSLNTVNIETKKFEWNTSFNLAHNRNRILQLYNGLDKVRDLTILREGMDSQTYFLIKWAGVDPRDGAPLWYDKEGNITRVFDLNNRVTGGTQTPDFFGGVTNRIKWGDFTLSSLINYTVGGYEFSLRQRDAESDGRNILTDNQSKNQLDRWREEGDLALAPKPVYNGNANSGRNSTRYLHKKTSWRLQNVSISYQLPKRFVERLQLANAYCYFQADNVGFWVPYKTESDRNDYRNSITPYPQATTLSLGLNVGF